MSFLNLTTAPEAPHIQMHRQAQALLDSGRLAEAEQAFRQLLAQVPTSISAMQALAHAVRRQGRAPEADALLHAAEAAAQVDLGQTLRAAGRLTDATPHFERAVALAPGNASYRLLELLHRATVFDEQGRAQDAMACFEQATQEHPQSADAWAALGVVQAYLADPAQAQVSLQRALQLDPGRTEVIEHFGRVLQDQGQYEDAALVYERLLKLDAGRPLAAGRLLHTKALMADWTALALLQSRVEAGLDQGQLTAEPFGLQGYCESVERLGRAARLYAAQNFPDTSAQTSAPVGSGGPKIRLGYLGGEFANQATSVLLVQLLELHDRTRFEVTVFDNGGSDGSPLRQRIEACCTVVPVRGVSVAQTVQDIRQRDIDVLVNLNVHFGRHRNHVFAARAAPVQVNYLGFPGTMGAPYMDYIIADRTVIPEFDQHHYSEKVVYLPHSYQPNDATRQVAAQPATRAAVGLPAQGFVFCCMNNVYKIMPAMFDVWMRLLRQVPGSVLLLYSKVPEAHLNLRAEAQARGVDGARIVFGPPLAHEEHLARLRLCDLFLDTLPYNAHTTGSDALWAGLPVLTCTGRTFPSRVGASLLRGVGMEELVTDSLPAYEALAIRLATEPGLLAQLRQRLAAQLPQAPLYDTPRYTRHLEAAYAHMVQRVRSGQPAEGFSVPA